MATILMIEDDKNFVRLVEKVLGQHGHETGHAWPDTPLLEDHPFFRPQTRLVLQNCGIIDPVSLKEYISRGGYMSVFTMLQDLKPAESIPELKCRDGYY